MRRYGLIGNPLTHSFSKNYFSAKFTRENILDARYDLFSLETIGLLPGLIDDIQHLCGLNVTIPYKEAILPFLHNLDEIASTIGAVNTIHVGPNKQLTGYNTDVYGFRQSIKPFLESHHERALILGTGGASKAVAFVLKEIGVECHFVTRHKNISMVTGQKSNLFTYEEVNEYVIRHFPLIVNTTPVGTYPYTDAAPPIPYAFLTPRHFLCDLIYNPAETLFLKEARVRGAITLNGLSMLQQQAEKAWEIWNT